LPAVPPRPVTLRDLKPLSQLRTMFSAAAARARSRALKALARRPITSPAVLLAYHELLLFAAAHPDDPAIADLVSRELDRIGAIAADLARRPAAAHQLADSGLPGTTLESTFLLDNARWLARTCPRDVEIAWADDESAGERLNDLLAAIVEPAEYDGVVNGLITMRQWFDIAAKPRGNQLARLLSRLPETGDDPRLTDFAFDAVELPIRWTIRDPARSRAQLRFPARPIHFQGDPIIRAVDVPAILNQPLPPPRLLSSRAIAALLDTARASLLVRGRQTDPVTWANPRETLLFRLERGIDILILGLRPGRRLPLESFFGYIAARNRVPVAYGGAWIWFDRAEIGINIFDTFRGGESAFLFTQIMRVYAQRFGARRFLVDPFQFGADNEEAIASGAYWFYDRLGYRPVDPALRRLADREREKRAADPTRRSSTAVLRRLAGSKLQLDLHDEPADDSPDELMEIALAITDAIAHRFDGDPVRARAWADRRAAALLGERLPPSHLTLLVALLPGITRWTDRQRRALAAIVRAKHGPREGEYVARMRRHPRLRRALGQLAHRGCRLFQQAPPGGA